MNYCQTCKKETNNPKFCSKSCSAKNTNKIPKRKRTNKCKVCGIYILSSLAYCKNCRLDASEYTLLDLQSRRKYQISSQIRDMARRDIKNANLPMICKICGYDKHVHVCHIKPIASFSQETKISTVNDISNLVILCPNCHWELDNNIFSL